MIICPFGHSGSLPNQHDKEKDHRKNSQKTQLFTNDRKDKIRMRGRQIKQFLYTLTQTNPAKAARAKSNL